MNDTAETLPSPLLHGQDTDTPLDLITRRLYFVWPLSQQQVKSLNTIIYNRYPFWINYWSLTHLGWGVIWGLLRAMTIHSRHSGISEWGGWVFSAGGLLVFHTLFEIWELWAGGYFRPSRRIDLTEWVDIVMDTVFAMLGYFIVFFLTARPFS